MIGHSWHKDILILTLSVLFIATNALAMQITDNLSIGGVLGGAYQYQDVNAASEAEDTGRGGLSIQPEISFTPTKQDEFFLKLGFGAGNGLNTKSPFVLAPWAASLEDDVKDINGRNRDYLLTAWYKHTFAFGEDHSLGLTGGLIDATDYLDDNAYSNDEYTQFMNEALVNGPNAFLPSYDIGGAFEWQFKDFSVKGVVMGVGANKDGNSYDFYGIQFGYKLKSPWGEGNYRVLFDTTSPDFLDSSGSKKEAHSCMLLSFDQPLGEIFGVWLRFGWGKNDAAILCKDIYSGGVNLSGKLWGRSQDNLGIGYAYLKGGNLDIDTTQAAEAYARFVLNDYLALTLDVQWMKDQPVEGEDRKGFIYGLRFVAGF